MVALELGVELQFQPLFDMSTLERSVYGDNPALKIPVLVDEHGPLFGTENICRALVRHSGAGSSRVVLRGEVVDRVVANSEELTLHAMSSGVSLVMAQAGGSASSKVVPSLRGSLDYLDEHLERALSALPPTRALSFLEVSLYCLVRHLEFRKLFDTSPFEHLAVFAQKLDERESARATTYRFDVA